VSKNPDTTPAAFAGFHDELKLDSAERKQAIATHKRVTELLLEAGLITGAFLQGSLARKTMINPLRDIDKVALIPAERFDELNVFGGPDRYINELRAALTAPFAGEVRFDLTNHSLVMDFGADSFSFDIVPAFEAEDGWVLIANRQPDDDGCSWGPSNTRDLIKVVADRNGECAGNFIFQARMIKHLVRTTCEGNLPGLHVEAIAYTTIAESLPHDEACARILEAGSVLLDDGGSYTDPTGVEQLSERLPIQKRLIARGHFRAAALRAQEALRLAADGDHHSAISIWRDIFGEPFPEPAGKSAKSILAGAGTAASVTSARTASPSTAGQQRSVPTRAWGTA
jgi:hypothetical protein